jgi:hypothetical protein
MAAPSHAFTIARAAEMLGESEELLWDLADQMEPEDGCLWVHGTGEEQTWSIFRSFSESVTGPSDPRSIADGYEHDLACAF